MSNQISEVQQFNQGSKCRFGLRSSGLSWSASVCQYCFRQIILHTDWRSANPPPTLSVITLEQIFVICQVKTTIREVLFLIRGSWCTGPAATGTMARAQAHTFVELEDNEAIRRECLGYTGGLVRADPGDWVLQPATAALAGEYRAMEVREEDVWIVTYPKVRPEYPPSPPVRDHVDPGASLAGGPRGGPAGGTTWGTT